MALVPLAIASVILWRAARPVDDAELQRFVDRFFVRIEPSEAPFVRARLRRSKALRLGAVAIGVLVAGLPSYMNLIQAERSSDFVNPIVSNAWISAAAIAALFVELMVVQQPVLVRRAAVEIRRPNDYISSLWTRQLGAAGSTTLALSGFGLATGIGERSELVPGAMGVAIALGATWVGLRQITDRPRMAPDGPLRAVDDGLRCHGAHHLVGAATALTMVSLQTVITTPNGWVWWALLGMAITYWGLTVWWVLARDAVWPVGRIHAVAR